MLKALAVAFVLIGGMSSSALADPMTSDEAREETAYTLGVQAYLWGAPLLYSGRTLAAGLQAGAVRMNDLRKFETLKTASDRFVTTPNNVTLDAYGAADVSKEPVVLFVPRLSQPRWYLVQVGDYFDEVARNIGGTHGEQPGVYLLTGPDFTGSVPGEMTEIKLRTRIDTVAVRLFTTGGDDLPEALGEQGGFRLIPLSGYLRDGLGYKSPDQEPSFSFAADAPDELKPFDEIGHWMTVFLPISADGSDPLVSAFHQIGLSVANGFDWGMLDEPTKNGLERAANAASQIVDARWATAGEITNGWKYTFGAGRAGYDLGLRAALAKYVTGAQVSDQVLYPNTIVDADGEALTGASKYVLHFDAGQEPPVSVFWNLNLFGPDMYFVENDLRRYSIGSTTPGLKRNADGSLDILIQHDPPADTANWLPAPNGPFNLTMRLYGPKPPVLDGTYRLPAVCRESDAN